MHVCVPVESKFSLAYPRGGSNKLFRYNMQKVALSLTALGHATGIGVVRSAHGNGKHADLGHSDLILGGSGRGLSGRGCTGKDEDCDESTDDGFHGYGPFLK